MLTAVFSMVNGKIIGRMVVEFSNMHMALSMMVVGNTV